MVYKFKAFFVAFLFSCFQTFSIQAQVFDYVVAKDGSGDFISINEAIEAVPQNTQRKSIFIKNGIYEEKVFIGSRWAEVKKKISLIGEHVDSVVITWSDYSGKSIPYPGKTGLISADGLTCPTLTVTSPDFYMENITVKNPATEAQAVVIYQTGDRSVIKNCKILGNQDSHRSKKGRRFFVYQSTIEGGVDFIYAGGTNYFYQCTINSNRNGFITAPEDITYKATLSTGETLRYGFFFSDCDITADPSVSAESVFLGRPWGPECGSVFLNCRMGKHINSEGWESWGGNENSACFAEFNSLNANGTEVLDLSNRVPWSIQLLKEDVAKKMRLSSIFSAVSSSAFDPVSMVISPQPVKEITVQQNQLSWETVANVNGYVVYANGMAIGFTKLGNYQDTLSYAESPSYKVKSVGALGNLSVFNGESYIMTADSIKNIIDKQVSIDVSEVVQISKGPEVSKGQVSYSTPFSLRIFDIAGRLVYEGHKSNNYNTNHLENDIYVLQSFVPNVGIFSKKILKR